MTQPWVRQIIGLCLLGFFMILVHGAIRHAIQAKRRWYEALAHGLWLDARSELWTLVERGELRARSATFMRLFHLQMIALNHENTSACVVNELRQVLPSDITPTPDWVAERPTWPYELSSVLEKMARATHMVARCQPGLTAMWIRWVLRSRLDIGLAAVRNLRTTDQCQPLVITRVMTTLVDASYCFSSLATQKPLEF